MAPRLLSMFNRSDKKPESQEHTFHAAVEVIAKSLNGSVSAVPPGSSWGGPGPTNSALVARVTQELSSQFGKTPQEVELAMARQGLSWGPPFPPGRPLDPFWGIRRPPRTRDFSVGENVQIVPRWGRMSFSTLKSLIDAYDVAQICIRHLINDVRSLEFHFEPRMEVREDCTDALRQVREFFESPDKRQPFRAWVAEYLQDVLRYDAGAFYIRRNEGGDPVALEVVSGPTIIPQIDFFGRIATDENDEDPDLTATGTFHGEITPAYLQIIQGMPWVWLAADDMIYQPWNPLPESQYGLAPMEAVLITANTDLRFQWHFLQYFTEGTLPAGFMQAPPDMSDPNQISEWQAYWDALMLGDQAQLRQIRWVPAGSEFQPAKTYSESFDEHFPLYLMRRVAAAFGVTPNDLGFTESVNRATGDTQIDVQFRVGTLPLVRHIEDVVNYFIAEFLKLPVVLKFDTGQEIQDRLLTARAEALYIEKGVISPDEPRARLGYPINRQRPTPRFIDNNRAGPIPLLALESLAGETDYRTFSPTNSVPLIDHQFASLPGVAPVVGSPEYKAAQATTAQIQADLIDSAQRETTPAKRNRDGDRPAPGKKKTKANQRIGQSQADLIATDGASTPSSAAAAAAKSSKKEAKEWRKTALNLAELLKMASNTGGPGLTAASGITGVDLISDSTTESKDMEEELTKVLRQWESNSINRIRKGLSPKQFESEAIPDDLRETLWGALQAANSPVNVRTAFAPYRGGGVTSPV